jgi:hypothetical protein
MGFTARYLGITCELSGLTFKIRIKQFRVHISKRKEDVGGCRGNAGNALVLSEHAVWAPVFFIIDEKWV